MTDGPHVILAGMRPATLCLGALLALCVASGASADDRNQPSRRAQPRPAPAKDECIILPGKSGQIEDRCKQIWLQCGHHSYQRLCGPAIKLIF
jgi:hypothetical protein